MSAVMRVVFAGWREREVIVVPPSGNTRDGDFQTLWKAHLPHEPHHYVTGPSARIAATALALREEWEDWEVLAPGELTRAVLTDLAAEHDRLRTYLAEVAKKHADLAGHEPTCHSVQHPGDTMMGCNCVVADIERGSVGDVAHALRKAMGDRDVAYAEASALRSDNERLRSRLDVAVGACDGNRQEIERLRRQMDHATPWRVSDPPTDEELRAIRRRWASGPARYRADADALIAAVIHGRQERDALEGLVAAVKEERRAEAIVEAARGESIDDPGTEHLRGWIRRVEAAKDVFREARAATDKLLASPLHRSSVPARLVQRYLTVCDALSFPRPARTVAALREDVIAARKAIEACLRGCS